MLPNRFSRQLSGGECTRVRQAAVRLSFDITLFLPRSKVLYAAQLGWRLHPLQHLGHGHEVDVVFLQGLVHPLERREKDFKVIQVQFVNQLVDWKISISEKAKNSPAQRF